MRLRRTGYGKPEPQGVDDYTGFEVPLRLLQKDWTGLLTVNPDIRNPQDFVTGVTDNQALQEPRPEVPDVFLAESIETETGDDIFTFANVPIFEEGAIVTL
jgi:hypothetical protein